MIPTTSWILLASLPAVLAGSPVTEASKYSLEGRSANVQARQYIELCAGSPVFQRCGGRWCAPPGMYCCGLGACFNGGTCLDSRWCCFAGMSEEECRKSIDEAKSLANDPSAVASMLTRSDIMSLMSASFTGMPSGFPTEFPAGGAPTQNGNSVPTAIAISGGSGNSNSGSGGTPSSGSGISTNGQRRRTIDLDSEVEYIEEWSTEIACSTENAGKRTTANGATLRMELDTNVAGFALSHSVGSDGKLSQSQSLTNGGGIAVGGEVSMTPQPIPNPTATNQTVIDSGCTISYIWTRGFEMGMIEQTTSLIFEFPIQSPAKRQEGGGGSWGRINGITLYSDEADLQALKVGDTLVIEKGPAAASGSGALTGTAAPGAATPAGGTISGARALAAPSALAALVAVAVLLA